MQNNLIIKISLLDGNARLPERQYGTDVGLDLFVASVTKDNDNIYTVNFGIAVEPPAGFYTELYPCFSIHKSNTFMVNGGVIEPDHRGPITMKIWCDDNSILPNVGDRFGKLVLKKGWYGNVRRSNDLSMTRRGKAGLRSADRVIAPPQQATTRYTVKDPKTGVSKPLFDDDEDVSFLH